MHLDHVAHPIRSPHETHRFYNGVLGLVLVQAYAGKELMLVYALPGGGSLAFTTQLRANCTSDNQNWEYEHVGLTVSSRGDLESFLQRLKQHGIPHRFIDDERIYFSDPDGLVLELEVVGSTPIDLKAGEILARWRTD
jgi:catechol 2,3-dioxygenase-like lactoylglutathione lyase family enzyme